MTQQIRANQLNEDIPYLHRTPFIVLWLASYGLAWFLLLLLYDVIRFTDISSPFASVTSWYKTSPGWMNGLVTGLIYGVALSTIQTWILHQRYGQPPRHWRKSSRKVLITQNNRSKQAFGSSSLRHSSNGIGNLCNGIVKLSIIQL